MPLPSDILAQRNRERHSWKAMTGTQTGPKTVSGRARSAARGLKHGARSAGSQALKNWVASINRLVRKIEQQH